MPLLKSEDAKALEKSLRLQIKQQGTTPLLNSTLGQLLLKQDEWEEASEAFRAALKQQPDGHDTEKKMLCSSRDISFAFEVSTRRPGGETDESRQTT